MNIGGGGGGNQHQTKTKTPQKKKKTTHTEDLTASEDLLFTCESFSPKRRTCSSQRLGGGGEGGRFVFFCWNGRSAVSKRNKLT